VVVIVVGDGGSENGCRCRCCRHDSHRCRWSRNRGAAMVFCGKEEDEERFRSHVN